MTTITFVDRIAGGPARSTDWIEQDPSANPPAPLRVFLELDPETDTAAVFSRHHSENAVPFDVHHERLLWWALPDGVDAVAAWQQITGPLAAHLAVICDGYDTAIRGSNVVGAYTADALAAMERVTNALLQLEAPDEGGMIEAGDWLVDGVDGLTAATTDDKLEAMAEQIETDALADGGWVVVGTLDHLQDMRDRMADEQE